MNRPPCPTHEVLRTGPRGEELANRLTIDECPDCLNGRQLQGAHARANRAEKALMGLQETLAAIGSCVGVTEESPVGSRSILVAVHALAARSNAVDKEFEKRHRQLVNAILRRARAIRNITHALVREEPEANDAWIELDNALKSLDDFAAARAHPEEG
jgi:hypothetical protein